MMSTCTDNDPLLTSYCGWIGGKSGQANTILIPRLHPLACESYVEVFAGGSAGLFFRKKSASVQTILNDKDPDVINMHECVAGQPDSVMAEMRKLRPSRLTFNEIKELRESPAWWDLPKPERAAKMLYVVKNSVNGNMHSYSISAKTASNYNPNFDLRPYARKLAGVQFECVDWRDLIHRLVFKPREARLFLYCEPRIMGRACH
jgi:site-specific DNA-adenine methylase